MPDDTWNSEVVEAPTKPQGITQSGASTPAQPLDQRQIALVEWASLGRRWLAHSIDGTIFS